MKLCKDCKFYKQMQDELSDLCSHEQAARYDITALVRGNGEQTGWYRCDSMRTGICGPEGSLFKLREVST